MSNMQVTKNNPIIDESDLMEGYFDAKQTN